MALTSRLDNHEIFNPEDTLYKLTLNQDQVVSQTQGLEKTCKLQQAYVKGKKHSMLSTAASQRYLKEKPSQLNSHNKQNIQKVLNAAQSSKNFFTAFTKTFKERGKKTISPQNFRDIPLPKRLPKTGSIEKSDNDIKLRKEQPQISAQIILEIKPEMLS